MADSVLAGRVALLTGASGGIGQALGRRLIAAGVRTGFAAAGHPHEAERLVAESADNRLDAVSLTGDLSDPQVPARLVRETVDALGPVDLLIANAGQAVPRTYTEVDLETWDRTLAVNLRAPFLLAQQVLPAMVDQGYGRVLFVSSVAAFTGGIVGPHYASSKAGLHGMLHFLAARVAAHGVTVNALAPGLIEGTRMLPAVSPEPPATPVGRYGRPEEVADLAMVVLGNGYLTNQVVGLDGGIYPR